MRALYMITASMIGTVKGLESLSPESDTQPWDWARLPAGNALVLVVEPDTRLADAIYAVHLAIDYAQTGHNSGNLTETLARLGRW